MTPADMERFMTLRHLSQRRLCIILGISQDRLRRMLDGVSPIPPMVGYALTAIDRRLPEWPNE